jgi:hypothetical protein
VEPAAGEVPAVPGDPADREGAARHIVEVEGRAPVDHLAPLDRQGHQGLLVPLAQSYKVILRKLTQRTITMPARNSMVSADTSKGRPNEKDDEIINHFAQQFSDGAKIRISRTFDDYLGGTLRLIDVDDGNNKQRRFSLSLKDDNFWFDTIEDVLQWSKGQSKSEIFRGLDFGAFITGSIAIIIVITIGWWAIAIRGDPPGYLGTALTTILGFYFGRSTRS